MVSSLARRRAPYHSAARPGSASFRAFSELSSGAMTPPARNGLLLIIIVCPLVFAALAVDTTMTTALARAADESQTRGADSEAELPSAPVVIDGTTLFRVRGTSSFPADKRAAAIASRIKALAADRAVPADAVRAVETETGSDLVADGHRLMTVLDADARYEALRRSVLAEALVRTIRATVTDYRQARSQEALIRTAVRGGVATVVLFVLAVLVIWLSRRARSALERTYRQRVQSVGIQTFQIVRAEQIWMA